MRKEGKVDFFAMLFIVQKENYKEMDSFIDLSEKIGADNVSFSQITNWGTYDDKEFWENVSMFKKDGNPKEDLKLVIDSNNFKSYKNSKTSNIRKYIKI